MQAATETHSESAPAPHGAGPDSAPRSVRNMWHDTVLTLDAQGKEEAFSIGPDGYIWSYGTQAESPGAGRLISTGLRADAFDVGRDAQGRRIVVGAERDAVRFLIENPAGPNRWDGPRTATLTGLQGAVGVDLVRVREHDANLFVVVRMVYRGEGGEYFLEWEGILAADTILFGHSPAGGH